MFACEVLTLVALLGAPAPVEAAVPAALSARNATIEPSGIVWAQPLERYLVVSDDTGTAGDGHRPWVFAMSRKGAFDDTTVPILGVDALNDAEAICQGPDGTFFLTTSHSPNKKGHTKPERRMLLHLELRGRALRVMGRADLTTARSPAGGSLLEIAGLDPKARLDIEALTFADGALLVGLKSPLSARGGAVIVRLADPVGVLAKGAIPAGAVTRVVELPLDVERDGRTVHQGISDLLALPGGSLVVLANSPKGGSHDGGGAMYWLKAGAKAPVMLQRFRGLKPEGVTLSEDGKGLVLVFDNDTRPPLWMSWPLPR